MKRTLFIFVMLLSVSSYAGFGNSDNALTPKTLKRRIVKEIAELKVNLDIPMLSAEVIDGINISTNYTYELYPSFMDSMYTRVDGWKLGVDINPGDILADSMKMPFGFSVSRGSEIHFVRHFKKRSEALLARPYGFGKVPLNAKILKSELAPGDMVSMPAQLTLSLGGSSSVVEGLSGSLFSSTTASLGIYLSGQFLIQVMRLEENKARLRLITDAARGFDASIGRRLGANLFGIEFVDNKINKVHPLALAELNVGVRRGKQFILDYVFDLNNNAARKAYNNIMGSRLRFKDFAAAKSMISRGQIRGENIASYELADSIFAEDKKRLKRGNSKEYRVQRLFKGSNLYVRNNLSIRLNILLAEHIGHTSFTKNRIVRINGADKKTEYNYQIRTKGFERSKGVGYRRFKKKQEESYFSLLDQKNANSLSIYPDLGISAVVRDLKFTRGEQGSFFRKMAKNLPRSFYTWTRPEKDLSNTAVNYKLIIKGELFSKIPRLAKMKRRNRHRLFQNYVAYLKDLKARDLIYMNEFPSAPGEVSFFRNLYKVVYDKELTAEKRQQKLMSLRKNQEFLDHGIGFILSLVSYSDMIPNISFEYSFEADNEQNEEMNEGDQSINAVYNQISDIQKNLEERSYDLRLAN